MTGTLITIACVTSFLIGMWIRGVTLGAEHQRQLDNKDRAVADLQARCNNLASNITELTNFAERNTGLVAENKWLKTRNNDLEQVVAEQGLQIAGALGWIKRPQRE